MKRTTIAIIGMIIAFITIVSTFIKDNDTGSLFGFEMDIWMYRLIWLALFGVILNGYLKERKKI
ncbi:hypothetical protein [Maribacter ulvicola]|uniref:Uncharacterized protein n=1 Tax=Maribacter ulvicola TaxID=228959 RepID=A0A1N6PCI9_9FLAO|nr:hypothetical protein [Maribacter ulvicola]SIQ02091.1 hypothetical protein SAMN05421797_101381 [Maribacter ulvicola]